MMKSQGSPQRSALENLVAENERARETVNELRREREELLRALRKTQGEAKSLELRLRTIENERQRDLAEIKRFMESLDVEKRERIKLLTELADAKNNSVRKDAEIASLKSQNQNLSMENERLVKQVESSSLQHVNAVKERQSLINSTRILQTKFQATEGQKKFQTNRANQLQNQLHRVRQQLSIMTKKYQQKQFGVQAIYKDEQTTKQRLLQQFQAKIADKDTEMVNQLQRYINQNSMLKQRIIQMKGSLN